MECLKKLFITYLPQYGDILKFTGEKEVAAAVYSYYLEKVPDDLGTMIKLGKLYRDMEVNEAAQMAFTYVLDCDLTNCAARAMLDC